MSLGLAHQQTGENYRLDAKWMWRTSNPAASGEYTYGLLFTQRRDITVFQSSFSTWPKMPCQDRRADQDRRTDAPARWKALHERRRGVRRWPHSITSRLDREGHAINQWVSNHRYHRVIQSSTAAKVRSENAEKIMLGANNYLGLADHPRVKEATIAAIKHFGIAAGSARVLGGTMDIHHQLEERLAEFKGTESCVLLPSGYMANFAVLP